MALIPCAECGSEVSNKAVTCPKCGNPIAKGADRSEKPLSWLKYISLDVGAIIVCVFGLSIYSGTVDYGNLAFKSQEKLAKRKQHCIEATMSTIGMSDSYKTSDEYREKVKEACEGMEINGVKVVP